MFCYKRKVMTLLILVALALPAGAQTKTRQDQHKGKTREEGPASPTSVKLVEPPSADFLSGEANVAVRGNQNPVIRLGLSPNGATIIEFPASDKLFNIIPGNSNLVTVEESPTKETDRFIIVRPGDGFASPATMANARRAAPHDAATEARRRSRVEGAEQMIQKNFSKPSIDPREVIEREGVDALAELLAGTGYITQRRALIDLAHALRSRKPLLVEGPRGGGKTALAESLAQGGNLTSFYLQGMDDLTMADVLYSWDREAQTQMVRQELAAGSSLRDAQTKQFSREYLIFGEAL